MATDINLNPFKSDRRQFMGGRATVTGIKYGCLVAGDTGSDDAEDVVLPSGSGAAGCRGVVSDQGDPNNSGAFAVGDTFGVCTDGYVEVLLAAGQQATKDGAAISAGTDGTVQDITGTPDEIVGYFAQTFDNS